MCSLTIQGNLSLCCVHSYCKTCSLTIECVLLLYRATYHSVVSIRTHCPRIEVSVCLCVCVSVELSVSVCPFAHAAPFLRCQIHVFVRLCVVCCVAHINCDVGMHVRGVSCGCVFVCLCVGCCVCVCVCVFVCCVLCGACHNNSNVGKYVRAVPCGCVFVCWCLCVGVLGMMYHTHFCCIGVCPSLRCAFYRKRTHSIENTFYRKRTHSVGREHIL